MRRDRADHPIRRLNEMAPGDLMQVHSILYDLSDGRASLPRIRTGEMLLCIRNKGPKIVVAKADGSRMEVSPLHANTVQVRQCA
jgi:hypothetical protein